MTMSQENKTKKHGKLQGPTYKRIKGFYKYNENEALSGVLKKHPNERHKNLVPDHTEKTFVWHAKKGL